MDNRKRNWSRRARGHEHPPASFSLLLLLLLLFISRALVDVDVDVVLVIIIIRKSNLCIENELSRRDVDHPLVSIIYSSMHYHSFIDQTR